MSVSAVTDTDLQTCRLDDGGLIGHIKGEDSVAKLSAAEAQELGRLTEADRLRLHRLLELAGGAPLAELQRQQPQLQPPAKGRSNAVAKRKEPEARTVSCLALDNLAT